MNGGLSLAGAVLTLALVLLMAYWCSRFLGKNWQRAATGRNLKVIEQMQVGPDRQLILLKLQEHTYLIGASAAGIQLLTEVEGELEPDGDKTESGQGFGKILESYISLHKRGKGGDR